MIETLLKSEKFSIWGVRNTKKVVIKKGTAFALCSLIS